MDYMFTKVMLYMCPHQDLTDVLQRADLILTTSFYIWYFEYHRRDFLTKAKGIDVEVGLVFILDYYSNSNTIFCLDI